MAEEGLQKVLRYEAEYAAAEVVLAAWFGCPVTRASVRPTAAIDDEEVRHVTYQMPHWLYATGAALMIRLASPPRPIRPERRTLALRHMTTHLLPALMGHRLSAVFLLLFLMGIRRGELLGLRWQDVDMSAGVVHIRQAVSRVKNHTTGRTQLVFQEPKTAASRRTIPLPEACLTALRSHRAHQAEEKLLLGPAYTDHGLVFCRADGAPIDPRTLNGAFTQALHRAGLPAMRLHDARHTYAT